MAALLGIAGAMVIHRVADLLQDRPLDGSLQAIADRFTIEAGEVTLDLPPAALGMLESEDSRMSNRPRTRPEASGRRRV